VRFIKEKHICLELQHAGESLRFSGLGWSREVDWTSRCAEMELQQGALLDVVYRLKAKSNPQFPGLELEVIDLRWSMPSNEV
jgi:single-stranded-DNA-specific exonuclease